MFKERIEDKLLKSQSVVEQDPFTAVVKYNRPLGYIKEISSTPVGNLYEPDNTDLKIEAALIEAEQSAKASRNKSSVVLYHG